MLGWSACPAHRARASSFLSRFTWAPSLRGPRPGLAVGSPRRHVDDQADRPDGLPVSGNGVGFSCGNWRFSGCGRARPGGTGPGWVRTVFPARIQAHLRRFHEFDIQALRCGWFLARSGSVCNVLACPVFPGVVCVGLLTSGCGQLGRGVDAPRPSRPGAWM